MNDFKQQRDIDRNHPQSHTVIIVRFGPGHISIGITMLYIRFKRIHNATSFFFLFCFVEHFQPDVVSDGFFLAPHTISKQ